MTTPADPAPAAPAAPAAPEPAAPAAPAEPAAPAAPVAPAAPEAAAQPLQAALTEASEGLLLPSESDAPFAVVVLPQEPTPESLRAASDAATDAPVTEATVASLLETLGQERPSFDEDEKAEAVRFQKLHTLIQERLKGAKVYRVGATDITVWVVGQDEGGAWLGLKSQLVETLGFLARSPSLPVVQRLPRVHPLLHLGTSPAGPAPQASGLGRNRTNPAPSRLCPEPPYTLDARGAKGLSGGAGSEAPTVP